MTTTTSDATSKYPVIRVSGAQGLVAAIPHCLGFHPTDSIVLLCICGARRRLGPLMRLDIDEAATPGAISRLILHASTHADEVVLVCFHDDERPPCLDVVTKALARADIPIAGVLSVHEGRIRDASTARRMRRDAGVALLDSDDQEVLDISSAFALAGQSPLDSREDLARSIRPPASWLPGQLHEHLVTARGSLAELEDCCRDAEDLALQHSRALDETWKHVRTSHENAGVVPAELVAMLITLCDIVRCRDELLTRVIAANDANSVAALIAVCAQCGDAECAEVSTILAAAAYRRGNGALAHCALDRAQSVRPHHRLAMILRSFIDMGTHPTALDRLAAPPVLADHTPT